MTLNLEFVNRSHEKDSICNPTPQRFILIDGAAGYGKSRLLDQVEGWYRKDAPTWKAVRVDLNLERDAVQGSLPGSAFVVANLIAKQLGESQPLSLSDAATWEKGLLTDLMPIFNSITGNVILLFDSIELLSFEAGNWLKRLINSLYNSLGRISKDFRTIFAGRNVKGWERNPDFPVRVLELSPFNYSPIWEMIGQVASEVGVGSGDKFLDELTWWTLRISGGHPGAIHNVLEILYERKLYVPDDLYFFFMKKHDFQFKGRAGSLFDVCVEPYIPELLRKTAIDLNWELLAPVLQAMSPVRHFNSDVLVWLFDQNIILKNMEKVVPWKTDWQILSTLLGGDLEQELDGDAKNKLAWDLIKRLLRERLISSPTVDNPMFSDRIVRRMLAMRLQLHSPRCYRYVHELALKVFDQWASADSQQLVKAEVRRVAIQDILFHDLMIVPDGRKSTKLYSDLQKRIRDYLSSIYDPSEVYQLKSALETDDELGDLVRRRLGGKAWFDLLTMFDQIM